MYARIKFSQQLLVLAMVAAPTLAAATDVADTFANSNRLECEFEFSNGSRKPIQGISCDHRMACAPTRTAELVHPTIEDFVVDFNTDAVRWVEVPRVNPAIIGTTDQASAEIAQRLAASGAHHAKITGAFVAGPSNDEVYEQTRTVVFVDPQSGSSIGTLTTSKGGTRAVLTKQGSAMDSIWTTLHFGRCTSK